MQSVTALERSIQSVHIRRSSQNANRQDSRLEKPRFESEWHWLMFRGRSAAVVGLPASRSPYPTTGMIGSGTRDRVERIAVARAERDN